MTAAARLALAAALLFGAAFAAAADDLAASDRALIRDVILGQIAAFRADDAEAAFAYAAPPIRARFGTAERFLDMVRAGYAPVYRPRTVEFQGLDQSGRLPVQEVLVVGPAGGLFIARYPMQRQADGSWRINGCALSAFDGRES